jgi:ferredoxin
MAKYKIDVDIDECIGCSACVAVCDDNWEVVEMDSMLKAQPKQAEVDELGGNKEAAEQCPVSCIHITDTESGEKLI